MGERVNIDDAAKTLCEAGGLSASQAPGLAAVLRTLVNEAEARGREAERADVVAYVQHCSTNEEYRPGRYAADFILRETAKDIEAGEHVGAAKEEP